MTFTLLLASPVAGIWCYGGPRIWYFAPLLISSASGLILFLLRQWVVGVPEKVIAPPGGRAALFFVFFLGVWIAFAPVPFDAILRFLRAASAVAAYWIWPTLALRRGALRWMLGLLLLSVACMGLYALIQHQTGSNMVLFHERPDVYGMRASGAYICPNHFAHLIVMTLCVALALIPSREAGGVLRLLSVYAWLVLLPALYLTQSRSGWIGLATGVLAVLAASAWTRGTRKFLLVLIFGPLLIALIGWLAWEYLPLFRARIEAAFRGDMRPPVWADTLRMWREQPWLGWGPGTFFWIFPAFRHRFTDYLEPRYAHNEYLDTLAETGVIGFAVLIAPYLLAVIALIRRLRTGEEHTREAMLSAGALGALSATAAHAFFDFSLQIYANLHVLMLIGGLAVAGQRERQPQVPPARSRLLIRGALLIPILGVVAVTVMSWRSAVWNKRGSYLLEELQIDAARLAFKRAVAWAPWFDRPYVELGELDRSLAFWALDPADKKAAAEQALQHFAAAERWNPWESDVAYGRQLVMLYQGREAESDTELRRLTERFPFQPYYLVQWGRRLVAAGRYTEAVPVFERAQKVSPSPQGEQYLIWLRQQMQRPGIEEKVLAPGLVPTPDGSTRDPGAG